MNRSIVSAICLLAVFALAACGAGNTAANTPAVNVADAANKAALKSNKPDEGPKEDPNKWREVTAPHPAGWDTLEKYGLTELVNTKALKKAPSGMSYLDGITNPKPPGATEQDDTVWSKWGEEVSAAALYYTGGKGDTLQALQDNGGKFVDGFDATSAGMKGNIAVATAGDGKYVLAAASNDNGTYIVVGVITKEENRADHQAAIEKWAGSLKTK